MTVFTRIWLCASCLWLAGCLGPPGPGTVSRNNFTGHSGTFSSIATVSALRGLHHHVLVARAYSITSNTGQQVYSVRVGKRFDGVHPKLRVDSAWNNQQKLRFKPSRRVEPFTHDMASSNTLVGTLQLSAAEFTQAASHGLNAHLLGPDGVYDIAVPAKLFAEALGPP